MYAETIFQFKKTLNSLDDCMLKAAAYADTKKFDVNILASARLAPDMFAFNRQVQSACDAAKFAAAYLSNQTAPKHEDTETTWTELRERIRKVQLIWTPLKEVILKTLPHKSNRVGLKVNC